MLAGKAIIASSWLVVVMACVALSGCAKPPEQPVVEKPPEPEKSAAVSPPPERPKEMPQLPSPKLEQVQQAVRRVFKEAVVIDATRSPSFLVGDFNGDQSQDLAVILKPAEGKLSELNREFPNWIAREPLNEVLPKSNVLASSAAKSRPDPASGQTVRFEQSDVLMAIIHGNGSMGWHDPEATQTHLLRHVVGSDLKTMPFKEAAKAYRGVKPFPPIYGDLIRETLIGQSGFIHFTGGVYGWYDPKNYKPEAVPMHGHPMASR
jgi:hypothetical protein